MSTPPLVQALMEHYERAFTGPNGNYPAVLESVAGVSVAQALWKPAPAANSIWRIVEHLIASKEWQIKILKNEPTATPVWIEPTGDEAKWQAALTRLEDAHRRLMVVIENIDEADLLKVPVPEWGRTLLELILSFGPSHDAHHSGQIDYLRGLQAEKT